MVEVVFLLVTAVLFRDLMTLWLATTVRSVVPRPTNVWCVVGG